MILADKIISLRKKQGWSQEELAHQLNVSRQAVSKWESTASIPELDKIIKMSQLFGVSTDYLLIDDLEDVEYSDYEESTVRKIDLETANQYLTVSKMAYQKIAFGVALCILSPVVLLTLVSYSELNPNQLTENAAIAIGLFVLFLIAFIAIAIFITYSMKLSKFNYLNEEDFDLEYGVRGVVEKRAEKVTDKLHEKIVIGIGIIFVAVMQLVVGSMLNEEIIIYLTAALLVLVSFAVYILTYYGMEKNSYSLILQEGEFSPKSKAAQKKSEPFSSAFWILTTGLYLALSFFTMGWHKTWIIWPIAGFIYAAINVIITKE